MKILVTGGSGKVGGHVVNELEKGNELRIFDMISPEEGPHKRKPGHGFVKGDLLNPDNIRKALEGMDAVAHLAANPWFSPTTFLTNAVGTYNMLDACRELGIKRFVMSGSDWGVGKSDERMQPPEIVPVLESDPCKPCDHYGLSKVVNEVTAEMYSREYGMKIAVLRQTGVWMPEQTDTYKPKDKKGADESCAKYWWTYIDTRDVARAFRAALEAPNLPAYGHYFIAAPDSMIDVPTMEALKKHWPKVKVRQEIPGFGSVLSIAAAKQAFGWEPIHLWRNK